MLRLLREATRQPIASLRVESRGRLPGRREQHLCLTRRLDDGARRLFVSLPSRRRETVEVEHTPQSFPPPSYDALQTPLPQRKLPVVCPGCGAPSQTVDPDSAGFYGRSKAGRKKDVSKEEDEIFRRALHSGALGVDVASTGADPPSPPPTAPEVPICDRCHYLLHQSTGASIVHPSMQSVQQIIEDSPHKQNHIYHVLDAADFPLSLIPNLAGALDLPRFRTQNRRSKSTRYFKGRTAEVSFVITRSDLLAPKKEQVDGLVPYLREVLREALGKSGMNIRLGNVRCVSAKRGWWTKTVKEEIWRRGGAGWMVGKANVGKSALFEAVFPKGRIQQDVDVTRMRHEEAQAQGALAGEERVLEGSVDNGKMNGDEGTEQHNGLVESVESVDETQLDNTSLAGQSETRRDTHDKSLDEATSNAETDAYFGQVEGGSLLPPAQPETAYPQMPLVSSLPGTTASPIRIPFGQGKGELIDLPGVHRSSLDAFVRPEQRRALVMQHRVVPDQHTIKPGQSLLLGGLIRITPRSADAVVLAYPFVTLGPHVTGTDKAVAIQTGVHPDSGEPYTGTVGSVATDEAKRDMRKAGTFALEWNVTKRRAGPLTDRTAGKQKADRLPFVVYSADILIEGVGWVELVCQVRSRARSPLAKLASAADGVEVDALGPVGNVGPGTGEAARSESAPPVVEVWSPEGKFVSARRPMNAWLLGGKRNVAVHKSRGRGRQSIDFHRRKEGGRGVRV